MSAALVDVLARLVPAGEARGDPETGRWREDGRAPDAVVRPVSTEEVAAVLREATREGWTVRVAGAGKGAAGRRAPEPGPTPPGSGGARPLVVLSTVRMTGIGTYEPADLTFTAEAGLELRAAQELFRPHRQWLPLDPPGWETATLGGLVAGAAAGPLRAAYGTPRDHVLGLTLVTGDGRVLDLGGRVVKNVAGFDLVRLAVGSRGLLGVVTRASLRLFPLPVADVTLIYGAAHRLEAAARAGALAGARLQPAALEILDPAPPAPGAPVRRGRSVVAVRLLGSEEAVQEEARRLEAAGGTADIRLAGARSDGFWREVARQEATDGGLALRMSLVPGKLTDLLEEVRPLADGATSGGRGRVAVHVTEGILRMCLEDDGAAGAAQRWAEPLSAARARLERQGGSLVIVQAPDAVVREVGAWGDPGPAARLIRGLRGEFDPAGVLAGGPFPG